VRPKGGGDEVIVPEPMYLTYEGSAAIFARAPSLVFWIVVAITVSLTAFRRSHASEY
jgi:aspartate/methionine/tyrosine aminotransferase